MTAYDAVRLPALTAAATDATFALNTPGGPVWQDGIIHMPFQAFSAAGMPQVVRIFSRKRGTTVAFMAESAGSDMWIESPAPQDRFAMILRIMAASAEEQEELLSWQKAEEAAARPAPSYRFVRRFRTR